MSLFDIFDSAVEQQPQSAFSFQRMAAERLSRGYEPIDWPTILVNQFRAVSLTRPLTICEKLLYQGAVKAVEDAQNEA